MSYQKIEARIEGVAPLMMSNIQTADPMNHWARKLKEISSKRKKTDDDHAEMARAEFLGRLYVGDDGAPCVPGEVLEAMLVCAAKLTKAGKVAKAGIIVDGNFPLIYEGPRQPEKLVENPRFRNVTAVRVGQARVMRTRPIFHAWALEFTVHYLPSVVDARQVLGWLDAAQIIGLMERRPRLGRFKVEKAEAVRS